MTTIHEMARMRLVIQAYNNFLGTKNIIFVNPESPVIPNIPELELEFLHVLMNKLMDDTPCTEHQLVLVDTTEKYRLKTYRCVNCTHIELKD